MIERVAVIAVSLLLVATKYFDCRTTATHMRGPSDETNPLARSAMERFGPKVAIWAVFSVVVLIVALVGGGAFRTAGNVAAEAEPQLVDEATVWGYVLLGGFISLVQIAVAQTNRTGDFNAISRKVLAATGWIQHRLGRDER
jgi:hypothetical protein